MSPSYFYPLSEQVSYTFKHEKLSFLLLFYTKVKLLCLCPIRTEYTASVFEKKVLRRISESWFIWHWMIRKNSINWKLTALYFCVPPTAAFSTESESSNSKS